MKFGDIFSVFRSAPNPPELDPAPEPEPEPSKEKLTLLKIIEWTKTNQLTWRVTGCEEFEAEAGSLVFHLGHSTYDYWITGTEKIDRKELELSFVQVKEDGLKYRLNTISEDPIYVLYYLVKRTVSKLDFIIEADSPDNL